MDKLDDRSVSGPEGAAKVEESAVSPGMEDLRARLDKCWSECRELLSLCINGISKQNVDNDDLFYRAGGLLDSRFMKSVSRGLSRSCKVLAFSIRNETGKVSLDSEHRTFDTKLLGRHSSFIRSLEELCGVIHFLDADDVSCRGVVEQVGVLHDVAVHFKELIKEALGDRIFGCEYVLSGVDSLDSEKLGDHQKKASSEIVKAFTNDKESFTKRINAMESVIGYSGEFLGMFREVDLKKPEHEEYEPESEEDPQEVRVLDDDGEEIEGSGDLPDQSDQSETKDGAQPEELGLASLSIMGNSQNADSQEEIDREEDRSKGE